MAQCPVCFSEKVLNWRFCAAFTLARINSRASGDEMAFPEDYTGGNHKVVEELVAGMNHIECPQYTCPSKVKPLDPLIKDQPKD